MKTAKLRWVFLLAALVGILRCLFGGLTVPRAAFAAGCWAAWVLLSRRKIVSLDRQNLRIPPRR